MQGATMSEAVWFRYRKRTPLLQLAACLLVGCCLCAAGGAKEKKLHVGDIPPDSLGRTAAGDPVSLSKYHGKVVIVAFFASWCAPCRKELPILASIQTQATHDQIAVFEVDWMESAAQYTLIAKRLKNFDFTFVRDSGGSYGERYDVDAIPHMVLIGRDGRVAAIHVGYGEGEIPILVKEINALLATPAPAPNP